MPEAINCAECGAPLPDRWPKTLCAHCALDGLLDLPGTATQIGSGPEPAPSPDSPPSPAGLMPNGTIGVRFGDYELLEEIARGGMGVVYRARQVSLNRTVALKMILSGQFASKQEVLRFRAEAEAAAHLRHPHIVAIHETGEEEGRHYFSMDYIQGRNLAEIVADGPLPARRAAQYVKTVAEAIHYAHEQGVLHRDLKPSNILIDQQDHPRITDFGLAKHARTDFGLTVTGQTLGSPSFMPPEQTSGKSGQVGPASDVYGLGAILYHLLTGRPPSQAETIEAVLRQLHETEPVAPRLLNPSIPRDLETICLKCLEKEPAKRYPSAKELAEELGRFLRDEPIQARAVKTPERIWRWCRRKPVLATLIVLVHVIGALGLAGILAQWQRAERNASAERHQRERAEVEKAEARRHLYVANMIMAQQAWEQPQIGRLGQLLNETRYFGDRGFEWSYWQQQTHLAFKTLRGHLQPVYAVAFSRDGQWIVTGSIDHTAKVWEAATGKLRLTLQHSAGIISVAFSKDGQWIATGSFDHWARVWNAATGLELRTIKAHNGPIWSVTFSPDGQRMATGSFDGAKVWDMASGQLRLTLTGHRSGLSSVVYSPDGQLVVTASGDGTAKVWDAATGRELRTLEGHTGTILSAAFSSDSQLIATASGDLTAKVWGAATGQLLFTYKGHSNMLTSVDFSPDGQRIVTGSFDQTAKVWDRVSGRELLTVKGHTDQIMAVAFAPDGHRFVTGSWDHTAKLWEAASDRSLLTLTGHGAAIASASFSSDGLRILTGSSDQTAKVWETATGREGITLAGHAAGIRSVAFSRDGHRIVTGSDDQTAKVWDSGSGRQLLTLQGHSGLIWSVAFSPDGQKIVTGSWDQTARVWDAATGRHLLTLTGHSGQIRSVAFSPDGHQIVTASSDRTAKVWEASNGRLLRTLNDNAPIGAIAFSPDGQRIVTGNGESTAKVWETASGRELLALKGHSAPVGSVAFSPDGQRIVTGSDDETAKVWEAHGGRELLTLKGHSGWVGSVAFSPDGQRIITGSVDQTAKVWNAARPEQVTAWQEEEREADQYLAGLQRERISEQERQRIARLRDEGAIKRWLILAPIPLDAGQDPRAGLDVEQVEGEGQLKPRAGEVAGKLTWQAVALDDYVIDFNVVLGHRTTLSVAYAVCYIRSEAEQRGLRLFVGSDDSAKVYLNGTQIHEYKWNRWLVADQDTVPDITLNAGLNVLVFKVVNVNFDWKGSIRFGDAQGNPVKGIEVTLSP